MEKQFVPYELSVKLKELGFDEECFGWYDFETFKEANIKWSHCSNYDLNWSKLNCTAPLWQQAFDWFRDKGYGAFVETWINGGVNKFRGRNSYAPLFITDVFDTYE